MLNQAARKMLGLGLSLTVFAVVSAFGFTAGDSDFFNTSVEVYAQENEDPGNPEDVPEEEPEEEPISIKPFSWNGPKVG